MKRNDRADTLAGKVTLISGLLLGSSEVLRSLRHYLRPQSQGRHRSPKEEELGDLPYRDERGQAIVSQTNIGTVSKETLGKRLRDGVERIWAFPNRTELFSGAPSCVLRLFPSF